MKLTSPLEPVLELSKFLDGDGNACTAEAKKCDRCKNPKLVQQPPDDMKDYTAGKTLYVAKVQKQARALADYRASLGNWHGVCMFCKFFPDSASGQVGHTRHTLNDCRKQMKYKFFTAKNNAKVMPGGKWFQDQCACFTCFNPKFICDKAKGDKCDFPDLVLPICWAVFQKRQWVKDFLDQLGGEYVKTDEKKYMSWLGEQQQVFGEAKASRAHAVVDFVFQQMENGHRFC
ncbi:unnamed protein product [Umbelopsis ramanniana]